MRLHAEGYSFDIDISPEDIILLAAEDIKKKRIAVALQNFETAQQMADNELLRAIENGTHRN